MSYCEQCAALRAEVERLREWNREIALNAREFVAENERLRAALELFACDCIDSGNLCPSPQNCRNYIARAAIAAAINAWPGAEIEKVFVEEDYLILPLRKDS